MLMSLESLQHETARRLFQLRVSFETLATLHQMVRNAENLPYDLWEEKKKGSRGQSHTKTFRHWSPKSSKISVSDAQTVSEHSSFLIPKLWHGLRLSVADCPPPHPTPFLQEAFFSNDRKLQQDPYKYESRKTSLNLGFLLRWADQSCDLHHNHCDRETSWDTCYM